VEFKEVRLTPKIGIGDFETKVHRAIEFLEDGDRLKVTVRFRGRELSHPEIGRALLGKFGEAVKEHGVIDRTPALEGKSMFMTIASVHKPRVHEHKAGAAGHTDGHEPEVSAEATAPAPAPVLAPSREPAPAYAAAPAPAAAPSPEPEPTLVALPATGAAPAGE
jgi:hypothetical protein